MGKQQIMFCTLVLLVPTYRCKFKYVGKLAEACTKHTSATKNLVLV